MIGAPPIEIKEQDLEFYFDGIRAREMDQKKLSRKSAQCLLLREKLLSLPDDVYESTFAAINALLSSALKEDKADSAKDAAASRKAVKQLLNQSKN